MTSSPFALLRTPVRRSPVYMGAVAVIALVLAIANSAASVAFPIGAGWERVINGLVTIDLLVTTVALGAASVVTARRTGAATPGPAGTVLIGRDGRVVTGGADAPPRRGALVTLGVVLVVAHTVLWLAFGLPALVAAAIASSTGYLASATATAVFAPLLVLGTAFSVIGFHRGGGLANRRYSITGAVLGSVMMAVPVLLAVLYAAGVIR